MNHDVLEKPVVTESQDSSRGRRSLGATQGQLRIHFRVTVLAGPLELPRRTFLGGIAAERLRRVYLISCEIEQCLDLQGCLKFVSTSR